VAAAERLERTPAAATVRRSSCSTGSPSHTASRRFVWIDQVPLVAALGRPDFKRVAPDWPTGYGRIVDVLDAAEIVHRDVTTRKPPGSAWIAEGPLGASHLDRLSPLP
jgi:hypothetical protein